MTEGNKIFVAAGYAKSVETGLWTIKAGYEVVTSEGTIKDADWFAYWRTVKALSPGDGYVEHGVCLRPIEEWDIIKGSVWSGVVYAKTLDNSIVVDVCPVLETSEVDALVAVTDYSFQRFPYFTGRGAMICPIPDMHFLST